jgi:transcription initiation factor TFIIE subunit alpha
MREETKANAQKPTKVEYFYIDYRRAIDAIKYKLYMLEEKLRREAGPTEEKKEYQCSRCHSEWTTLEVVDKPDPLGRKSGFLCHRCDAPLDFFPNDPEAAEANGPLGVFNEQFGWLISALGDIDKSIVPETSKEAVLVEKMPVPEEKMHGVQGPKFDLVSTKVMPTAVKGINTGPEKVEISITTNSETTAAQQAAAAAQKAHLAAQNQLPAWHTRSTVTNEMTAAGQREEAARREREAEAGILLADSGVEQKAAADSSLEAIFAQLEQDALAQQAEQDEDDEEEEEEEEDEEFEDVLTDAQPEAKRVKLEEHNGTVTSSATGTPAATAVDEDSEAEEFEDV